MARRRGVHVGCAHGAVTEPEGGVVVQPARAGLSSGQGVVAEAA
jgi:hypothetical protein